MTRPDLDTLRKLCDANDIDPACDAHPWCRRDFANVCDALGRPIATCLGPADADLIVAAVNALPELIAWIEALEAERIDRIRCHTMVWGAEAGLVRCRLTPGHDGSHLP